MKIHEKYLEALKTFDDFVTVSEWAERFTKLYPDDLERAEKQALNQKNDTTGLREIIRRISSLLSTGSYAGKVQIDDSEKPRKVKFITDDELAEQTQEEINEDIEPLRRQDIINSAVDQMEILDMYRLSELENIQKAFKLFFGIDFEIDHAEALLNPEKQGAHHPDNLQLLLKYHNGKKNKNSWKRFTLEEQIEYIKQTINLHGMVADKLDIQIDQKILNSLLERLKLVY